MPVIINREIVSIIPAFELGVWNAWILVIPLLLVFFFAMKAAATRESGKSGDFKLTRKENTIANAIFLPMVISFICAVFLPLQLGTPWLYIGLPIYLFGIVFIIVAILNFASSPEDKVITKGLYCFTRNPMSIGLITIQIGLGIASSSWLYLLLKGILMILLHANSSAEERYCLHRYGEAYQEYMDRTPRWIGMPKSNRK